jgi:hypothetical protein
VEKIADKQFMAEEKNYTIIPLSLELRREIEDLVGPRNLSSFIIEATERELRRQNQAVTMSEQMKMQERVFIN